MFYSSRLVSIWCILLIFLSVFQVNAQKKGPSYPYSSISKELLENSYAVIREDITKYEIIDKGKGKSYTKVAITILNKKADHLAEVYESYDKLSKINSIEGRSYDKFGKIIDVLKKSDIQDFSAYDGFSIYSDNRIKYFDLRHPDYPYTIEYEIESEDNGLYVTPGWSAYPGFYIASEKSSLEISAPEGYEIRYKELNMEPSATKKTEKGITTVSWEFGAFPSIERESRMPFMRDILPTILTAPSAFEMEGYEGDMGNWKSLGLWEMNLNEGRDELPPEFSAKIKDLVKGATSRTEKIEILYNYLQDNTRYVSIQLGIGGLQTFPATDVIENGYGDCKALSNFMKAILQAADIDAYYTSVRAGNNVPNIIKEFPSHQFNHIILCVPNYQDTVWLECTSQDNPFGYMGHFTGDRDVLVLTNEGGKIVHTKTYVKEENTQLQHTNVSLAQNGSAVINLSVASAGLQYDRFSHLLEIGEGEQKKWLYKNLDLPGFELVNFKFDQKKQPIPELYADIDLTVNRFASVSGKRIFFQPNVFNKTGSVAIPQKERKFDFIRDYPYEDIDTVNITIPDGYHMEYLPEKTIIESDFGVYQTQVIAEEGKVNYIRNCSMVKGTFPAKDYLKYVEFRNKIAEADKMKLVLVKST